MSPTYSTSWATLFSDMASGALLTYAQSAPHVTKVDDDVESQQRTIMRSNLAKLGDGALRRVDLYAASYGTMGRPLKRTGDTAEKPPGGIDADVVSGLSEGWVVALMRSRSKLVVEEQQAAMTYDRDASRQCVCYELGC